MSTRAALVLLFVTGESAARAESFGADVTFLRAHTEVVVLGTGGARVAVAPAWQGRGLASTRGAGGGRGWGWRRRGGGGCCPRRRAGRAGPATAGSTGASSPRARPCRT